MSLLPWKDRHLHFAKFKKLELNLYESNMVSILVSPASAIEIGMADI
jgi:hypothetical protein